MVSFKRAPSDAQATHRLAPGDAITPRELTTIGSDRIRLPASDLLTHLQFRRFAACPVCNVHLRSVARRHGEIVAAGIREVVVFHSPVEAMLPHQGGLPFAVVADPDRELYTEFGVESSPKANLHPRVWTGPLKPQSWSVVAGGLRAGGKLGPQGESMLGLPADFLIDPDGQVLAVHYGTHANDQWPIDELLRQADESTRRSTRD
ncbi:MAG: redoxin domain-containing protein [Pseudonocardiaceae bacterium]|nr:redoxin domain-containing protein [Pseudonocardiaceae bacterium]